MRAPPLPASVPLWMGTGQNPNLNLTPTNLLPCLGRGLQAGTDPRKPEVSSVNWLVLGGGPRKPEISGPTMLRPKTWLRHPPAVCPW